MGEGLLFSPNAWDEFNDVPSLFRFVTLMQETTGKPVGIKIVVGRRRGDSRRDRPLHEGERRGSRLDHHRWWRGRHWCSTCGLWPTALVCLFCMPSPLWIPSCAKHGVRDETMLIASGQIARGDDVAIAIAMGADMVNIGRGNLIAEGCIMALRCHTNQCPTGITTQDPRLRRGLDPQDKYVKVANYNMVLQRVPAHVYQDSRCAHPLGA
jgi:hypothetical protein